jgi:hypothetical protein
MYLAVGLGLLNLIGSSSLFTFGIAVAKRSGRSKTGSPVSTNS